MIDLHLHTSFSHDSSEDPSAYIERAMSVGAEIIGFAEHYDYDFYLDGQCLGLPDLDKYFLVSGSEKVKVLHGVEVGYRAEAQEFYKNFVRTHPFDYVINSVHMLPDGACASRPVRLDGQGVKNFYTRYLSDVYDSVCADYDFQIVGHIGYASRYVLSQDKKLRYEDFSELYDKILREIIARGKCLELNTSSAGTQGDFLPDRDIFMRYRRLGGRLVSYGSDAHRAFDLLRDWHNARDFLLSAGFNKICYFVNKKCMFYNL